MCARMPALTDAGNSAWGAQHGRWRGRQQACGAGRGGGRSDGCSRTQERVLKAIAQRPWPGDHPARLNRATGAGLTVTARQRLCEGAWWVIVRRSRRNRRLRARVVPGPGDRRARHGDRILRRDTTAAWRGHQRAATRTGGNAEHLRPPAWTRSITQRRMESTDSTVGAPAAPERTSRTTPASWRSWQTRNLPSRRRAYEAASADRGSCR